MTSGSVRLSSRLVGAEIFRVELQRDRDAVRVVPVGELDIATVGQVDQLLRELGAAGVRSIVCDLRRLEFVDCSGARLLLECGAVPVTRAGGWSSSRGSARIERFSR